jgi:serine/threonine-protein kinase
MDTKRWTSLNSIIDQALELEPDKRLSFVNTREGLTDEMRNEAIEFLKSIEKSDTFWDDLMESSSELIHHIDENETVMNLDTESSLPEQIGPYKVIKKLASGGMGNVYLAKRTDGHLQITVALKLLRQECVDSHHIHQFNIERNVLGRLNHPNIARIYDGGITDNGRPYLVMEYVEGTPVTEYCRTHQCSIENKIKLFEQICEGVNFAHSNLVVHRDLKPDNIFISKNGSCKILDFGIAKIIQPEDNHAESGGSQSHLKPFSICHAAPEQLSGGDIRTATDVYSLGLLLHELLTGTLPYNLSGKSPAEANRIIRETPLSPPSSLVQIPAISKTLKGDLDEIITKCLQADPDERYQSAGELLADLRNYQNQLPLSFKQHQKAYKLKKFSVRNGALLSGVVAVITILSALTIYYINTIQEEREKAIAEEQQASFIAGFMVDLFGASDPIRNVDDTLDVYDILQSGVDKLDNWEGTDLSKADIMISLGNAYKKIGDFEQSQTLLEDAFKIYIADSGDSLAPEMLNPTLGLAHFYNEERNYNSAAHYFDRSLNIINNMKTVEPEDIANIYSGYGLAMTELDNPELAIMFLERAIAEIQISNLSDSRLATAKTNLAKAYRRNRDYQKSEELYKEILNALPADAPMTMNRSIIHNNLGYLLKVQGRIDQAATHYSRSLEINRYVLGLNHPNTKVVMNNLAALHVTAGRFDDAERLRLDLLNMAREDFGDSHWRTGSSYEALGILKLQSGEIESAPEYFERASEIYSDVLGDGHIWTERAILYYSLCRFNTDESDQAKELFRETVASLKEKRLTFSRYDVDVMNNLIENFDSYRSISNTSDFALLADIK